MAGGLKIMKELDGDIMTLLRFVRLSFLMCLVLLIVLTSSLPIMAENLKSDTSYQDQDYSIVDPMIYQKQDSIAAAIAFIGKDNIIRAEEKLADKKYLKVAKKMIYAWKYKKPELLRSMFSSKTEEFYKKRGNPEYMDTWANEMAEKYLFQFVDTAVTDARFYVTYSPIDPTSKKFMNTLKWSELPETPVGYLYMHCNGKFDRALHYVIENDDVRISLEIARPYPSKSEDKK